VLPEELIATQPAPERDGSRLLILSKDDGGRNHCFFRDLLRFLRPRSLVVMNDTRVIPARLFANKPTGGRIEVFLVEKRSNPSAPLAQENGQEAWQEDWQVLVRGLGRSPVGARLTFDGPLDGALIAEVVERGDRGAATLRFSGSGQGGLLAAAEAVGEIPLPPYIESARKRAGVRPTGDDRVRYQTVFAKTPGAVAAPTAGLHFTEELLSAMVTAGHEVARITLHVGPGTFRPVATRDPSQHHLDAERFEVSASTAAAICRAQAEGRPIVAVGTTVVRTLETLARRGAIEACAGATDLLILPGDELRIVTDLITNFHLPKSSLLMLVSAFAGRERVLAAYRDAIERGYRFYSYGDAMFIRPGVIPS
jgi:S-adenosylmethionine:tRNA ribosyltransferase-isomerase